jgi:hypothetical protein
VKKMEGVFEDIAFGTGQVLITASLNKNIQVMEYCD